MRTDSDCPVSLDLAKWQPFWRTAVAAAVTWSRPEKLGSGDEFLGPRPVTIADTRRIRPAREMGRLVSDDRNLEGSPDPIGLKQGDLGLLESDVARRLLSSRIPARFAYIAIDGTPRVLATWFHWTGKRLAMPTFLAAPHVRHPAGRLRALRANPDVAVTIDTETFPPEVLTIRGRVEISEVEGVPRDYRSAARRFLGDAAAAAFLAQFDQPGTRMASIDLRPTWVGLLDFQSRLPSTLGGVS
jgi:hypothetical protein